MVAGKEPLHGQLGHLLQGFEIGLGVGGGEPGGEQSLVDQVPGEQVAPLRLPEAHVARGMAGGVEHLEISVSQMDGLPAPEHPGWGALEKFVGVHVVALGQLAAVGHIAPNQLNGLGKAPLEPGQLRFMGVKVRVVAVPADVVPVNVGGHRCHRPPGQSRHHRRDIADTQACVN